MRSTWYKLLPIRTRTPPRPRAILSALQEYCHTAAIERCLKVSSNLRIKCGSALPRSLDAATLTAYNSLHKLHSRARRLGVSTAARCTRSCVLGSAALPSRWPAPYDLHCPTPNPASLRQHMSIHARVVCPQTRLACTPLKPPAPYATRSSGRSRASEVASCCQLKKNRADGKRMGWRAAHAHGCRSGGCTVRRRALAPSPPTLKPYTMLKPWLCHRSAGRTRQWPRRSARAAVP